MDFFCAVPIAKAVDWFASSRSACSVLFFFFNDTATTEIYTLSLHDALPIYRLDAVFDQVPACSLDDSGGDRPAAFQRSEEHTSELQSRLHLVCRLLLEKKKKIHTHDNGQLEQTPLRFSADVIRQLPDWRVTV